MESSALFLHMLGGSAWLGGSVFANFVLVPHVFNNPVDRQRDLVRRALLGPERLMIAAAVTTGLVGLLLGVLGRIRSFDALGTTYGLLWLASIVVIVAVFGVGGTITSPAMRRLLREDGLWRSEPTAETARARVIGRLTLGFRLELTGLVFALGLMALLRYA